MITLCNITFIERHTVECQRTLLLFTIESLEQIRNWQSPEARNAANALYNSIRQSDYIVGLVVLDEVSGYLLPLTRLLQTVGLDLVQAMHEIDALLGTLNSICAVLKLSRNCMMKHSSLHNNWELLCANNVLQLDQSIERLEVETKTRNHTTASTSGLQHWMVSLQTFNVFALVRLRRQQPVCLGLYLNIIRS